MASGVLWYTEGHVHNGLTRDTVVNTPHGIGHIVQLTNIGAIVHMIGGADVQDWGIIPYSEIKVTDALKVLYGQR